MSKRTSITDLARELSVSVSTVSRALNNHHSISKKMKKLVFEKAKELNYRPNTYAVNLKKGNCNTIAVIVPQINRFFFSSVINGIEEVAREKGFDVMIYQSDNDYIHESKIVNSLSFGKVDGVIASVANTIEGHVHYQKVVDYGMPLVFFDRILTNIDAGTVRIDDFKASYLATEHFIKQGMTKIFHFAGNRNVIVWDDRAKGYEAAMRDYSLEIEPSWIYENFTTEENGEKYMREIISQNNLPQAINFAGDYAALGAMKVLKEQNISIPNDILISGFACEPFCDIIEPSLTSVNQFAIEMGREAAEILIDKISGKSYRNTIITPELIIRDSSLKK